MDRSHENKVISADDSIWRQVHWTRDPFFPPTGGEPPKSGTISPPDLKGWGGNIGIFPPLIWRAGGEISGYFPPPQGGKPRKFWEIGGPNYRFPFRKSHFQLQNSQNFRLRRLVTSYGHIPNPQNFRLRRFWNHVFFGLFFLRKIRFVPPPESDPWGGGLFGFPPNLKGWGGTWKIGSPPAWGKKRIPGNTLYVKSVYDEVSQRLSNRRLNL